LETDNWFVPGNREYDVRRDYSADRSDVSWDGSRYCSFAENGVRFIKVDGNDLSIYATTKDTPRFEKAEAMFNAPVEAEAVNAQRWNDGIGKAQFAWLETELDAVQDAGELVIAFNYFPAGHARQCGVIYRMTRGYGRAVSMLGIGFVSSRSILAKASTCIYSLAVCHSSFCSNGPAPTTSAFDLFVQVRDWVG